MQEGEGATACLAGFIRDTSFDDLPPEVVHDTRRIICDSIACAVGGTSLDGGKTVVDMAKTLGGPPESSIMANGGKVSPASAAFANTYLGNVLDTDETLLFFSHHAVCAVFPALAVVESLGLDGKDLITAVAIGYDVGARIGLSLPHSRITGTGSVEFAPNLGMGWETFAAVAAAGKAFKLDVAQLASAFGIAGYASPMARSRFQQVPSGKPMVKYAPYASMGFVGIVASQMARLGFSADPAFFDGDLGYWKLAGASEFDWGRLLGDLRERWWITETSIKPYAAGRYAHHSVDLLRQIIREQVLTPGEIERVEVKTLPVVAMPWLSGLCEPQTQIDMQFSIPLALAATAYGLELSPEWQSPERMKDHRLFEFASRVKVEADRSNLKVMADDISRVSRLKRIPTTVTVSARGQVYRASSDYAWGDPWLEETRMSDEQLRNKFRSFCSRLLRSDKIEAALETLYRLETVDNVSDELIPLLS